MKSKGRYSKKITSKQAFDVQRDSANRNNERLGINPNSGNALALNSQKGDQ